MGITQALKLQEGPIDALARLDQKQIIALAQQKRIPADMVSVIINEKALMEQEAANMAAAQKTMPSSVLEQAMAINAQAEAMRNQPQVQAQPQMMAMAPQQEMPPMDAGVAALPVDDSMYNMAGGGIVAFAEGGDLASMFNATTKEMDEESARREPLPYAYRSRVDPNRVRELAGAYGDLRKELAPESAQVDAIKKFLDDQARKTTDTRTDAWTRALEAGLGILGGESPYALTNIGKGSQAAVKGFAEDVKERRKQTLADMQLKLQLDEAARKEKLGAVTSAEGAALKELEYERDLERSRIASQKEKVMDTYANNFLEAYRDKFKKQGLSDAQILQLGREDYLNRSTAFDPRMLSARAAGAQATFSGEEVERKRFGDAAQLAEKTIFRRMSNDPRNTKYKELLKTDKDAALRYKNDVIRELVAESGGAPSAPPAAPTSDSAPPSPKKGNAMFPARGGSKFLVTAPNGQVFEFNTQAQADAYKARIGAK
jgi:hypothetical protein